MSHEFSWIEATTILVPEADGGMARRASHNVNAGRSWTSLTRAYAPNVQNNARVRKGRRGRSWMMTARGLRRERRAMSRRRMTRLNGRGPMVTPNRESMLAGSAVGKGARQRYFRLSLASFSESSFMNALRGPSRCSGSGASGNGTPMIWDAR